MEVVLSPGRFGDETPAGVPFENEEIREWSHVDRLTGMLERARVETGRWRASNQGAARSYGKVIDSRERNSADGNIVQRARRQVEIFQSQGRGRSVQVVRASQWSSSRVTDSCTTNATLIPTLPDLDKKETEKLVDSSRFEGSEKLFPHQQDAMSERLSNLLGSLAISSTVPLRRIDSKYSSRAAIFKNSKRSNSNEDLSMNLEKNLAHRPRTIVTSSTANVPCSRMENSAGKNVFHENILNSNRDEENYRLEITANDEQERQPRATKSAIHLLPSSKSNTTVVNLMKDSRPKNIDNDTKTSDDKCWMVSWIHPPVKTPSESIDDSSATSGFAGKIPKRVGFSKTEIHFAADSGKVNIVETDEKPPPTNKFRRRRRSHLAGSTNKILPILDSSQTKIIDDDKIENSMENAGKTRSDVQQRVHTTTVNLGSEIMKKDERVNDESTTTIDDSSPSASNSTRNVDLATKEDYDIVCTDAENNQVLLKVVTTHEPTIARVENDHYRKLRKRSSNVVKSKNVEKTLRNEIAKNDKTSNEHTYVNVFTGCETNNPIYENYKATSDSNFKSSNLNTREIQENCDPSKNEEKSLLEKSISRVHETKNPSNDISITRELENSILERIRTSSDEKSLVNASDQSIAVNSRNKRGKMRKNNIPSADKKSTAGELSPSNSINSAVNSRSRTCKISKNLATVRTLAEPLSNGQNSDSGFPNKSISNDKKINCPTKSSKSRQVPLAKTRNKNESRQKPLEVVYQTAVYNMKNEKLSKPLKAGKQESRGPRYLNELICGAKTKRSSDCKNKSKTSSSSTENSNNRGALQTVRHWK